MSDIIERLLFAGRFERETEQQAATRREARRRNRPAARRANALRTSLGRLADALEARLGTNAAEWPDVRQARALLELA